MPGCTKSPGSTLRVRTIPVTSLRTWVLASCACRATRRSRSTISSALPGASASAFKRADSTLLRARLSAFSDCSSSSFEMTESLAKIRLRCSSRLACANCTCALAKSTLAWGRVLLISSFSAASAWRTCAVSSSDLSTNSKSPRVTRSPSCTRRLSTTPVISLPTCVRDTVTTRPVATTVCTNGIELML